MNYVLNELINWSTVYLIDVIIIVTNIYVHEIKQLVSMC